MREPSRFPDAIARDSGRQLRAWPSDTPAALHQLRAIGWLRRLLLRTFALLGSFESLGALGAWVLEGLG